jgi:hypothetical protein
VTGNVVRFEDYRRNIEDQAAAEAANLSGMSYYDLCDWAGANFERLRAAARARDYRPEWISHQLAARGIEPTLAQAAVLDQMIAAAGEFVSRRQRWILRQLKENPTSESALVKLAIKAPEFCEYKHPDRCVANDIGKLVERNLIQTRGGLAYYPVSEVVSDGAA